MRITVHRNLLTGSETEIEVNLFVGNGGNGGKGGNRSKVEGGLDESDGANSKDGSNRIDGVIMGT